MNIADTPRSSGSRAARAASLALLALALGCGFTASKGNEPSGSGNLPSSGVGPFLKQDFFCNTQLVQPFILTSPADGQRGGPALVHEQDDTFQIWSELRSGETSRILHNRLTLLPGTQCRDFDVSVTADEAVLSAEADWEAGSVGAPSVLVNDGLYRIWFEGGNYAGIGYAESNDGLHWTRRGSQPVLAADQRWEAGTIGSPTVVFHDGLYRMWYDGNVNAARSIGYAESSDGVSWTKRDAFGRSSEGGRTDVVPVITADQTTWEFYKPTYSSGSVGAPSVVVHRDPLRTYYLLYYTGNLRGRLDTRFDDVDSSIGIAFSENGLDWTKAPNKRECEDFDCPANEINPNVAEKLPISLGPKVDGSFNSFSGFSIVDETEPAVVEVPEQLTFFMLWHQVDQINAKVAPGLPPDDATLPPDGFTGATGIGFAFASNLPS